MFCIAMSYLDQQQRVRIIPALTQITSAATLEATHKSSTEHWYPSVDPDKFVHNFHAR